MITISTPKYNNPPLYRPKNEQVFSPEEHEGLVLHRDQTLVELLQHDARNVSIATFQQVQSVILRKGLVEICEKKREKMLVRQNNKEVENAEWYCSNNKK